MDQVLLDHILSWLLLPFVVLADLWTAVVSGICRGLSWIRDALHDLWTIAVFGIAVVLSWLLVPYHTLGALPYLWVRGIFGISIGLLITEKTIGLLWCVLGNVVLFAYAGLRYGPPEIPIALRVASAVPPVRRATWASHASRDSSVVSTCSIHSTTAGNPRSRRSGSGKGGRSSIPSRNDVEKTTPAPSGRGSRRRRRRFSFRSPAYAASRNPCG